MGWEVPVGLALTAVGTGISMASAVAARSDADKSMRNQLLRQQELQRQATPVFEESLKESTPERVREQLQEGADVSSQLSKELVGLSAAPTLPMSERTAARTKAAVEQRERPNASLQGLANLFNQQALRSRQAGMDLGTISNLAQSSAALTPTYANLAMAKSADLAGVGSLFSTAGGLASLYGAVQPGLAQGAMNSTISNRVAGIRSNIGGQ